MSDINRIQSAQAEVAELQDALATVQSGLQRAEEVAAAAAEVERRAERALKVALGLIGVSVVLLLLSRRRPTG